MERKKKRAPQVHISAYVDEDLRDRAKRLADAEQRTLSSWFRRLIVKAVEARP